MFVLRRAASFSAAGGSGEREAGQENKPLVYQHQCQQQQQEQQGEGNNSTVDLKSKSVVVSPHGADSGERREELVGI